jgi:4-hydroxy-tetrahydrodipicolinate synthase
VGVKAEAPPTSGRIASLRATNPDLGLLGGLGGLFLIDELRAGANGVMTGFALPEQLVAIVETFRTDAAAATATWERLLPLMRLEAFQPFSLAARKEVWRLRGVIESSHCRRPGAVLDDRARDDVRRAVAAVVA